jgi:prepilin-type processing-associated H-X9-DG protein
VGIAPTAPDANQQIINNRSLAVPGYESQPSSNHPGGVVVAFCDGHTGFLKESLTRKVYAQLLSSNGRLASTLSRNLPTDSPPGWGTRDYVLQDSDYK